MIEIYPHQKLKTNPACECKYGEIYRMVGVAENYYYTRLMIPVVGIEGIKMRAGHVAMILFSDVSAPRLIGALDQAQMIHVGSMKVSADSQ